MSFVINETMEGKIIEVQTTGKLTRDVDGEFVCVTESAIRQH